MFSFGAIQTVLVKESVHGHGEAEGQTVKTSIAQTFIFSNPQYLVFRIMKHSSYPERTQPKYKVALNKPKQK